MAEFLEVVPSVFGADLAFAFASCSAANLVAVFKTFLSDTQAQKLCSPMALKTLSTALDEIVVCQARVSYLSCYWVLDVDICVLPDVDSALFFIRDREMETLRVQVLSTVVQPGKGTRFTDEDKMWRDVADDGNFEMIANVEVLYTSDPTRFLQSLAAVYAHSEKEKKLKKNVMQREWFANAVRFAAIDPEPEDDCGAKIPDTHATVMAPAAPNQLWALTSAVIGYVAEHLARLTRPDMAALTAAYRIWLLRHVVGQEGALKLASPRDWAAALRLTAARITALDDATTVPYAEGLAEAVESTRKLLETLDHAMSGGPSPGGTFDCSTIESELAALDSTFEGVPSSSRPSATPASTQSSLLPPPDSQQVALVSGQSVNRVQITQLNNLFASSGSRARWMRVVFNALIDIDVMTDDHRGRIPAECEGLISDLFTLQRNINAAHVEGGKSMSDEKGTFKLSVLRKGERDLMNYVLIIVALHALTQYYDGTPLHEVLRTATVFPDAITTDWFSSLCPRAHHCATQVCQWAKGRHGIRLCLNHQSTVTLMSQKALDHLGRRDHPHWTAIRYKVEELERLEEATVEAAYTGAVDELKKLHDAQAAAEDAKRTLKCRCNWYTCRRCLTVEACDEAEKKKISSKSFACGKTPDAKRVYAFWQTLPSAFRTYFDMVVEQASRDMRQPSAEEVVTSTHDKGWWCVSRCAAEKPKSVLVSSLTDLPRSYSSRSTKLQWLESKGLPIEVPGDEMTGFSRAVVQLDAPIERFGTPLICTKAAWMAKPPRRLTAFGTRANQPYSEKSVRHGQRGQSDPFPYQDGFAAIASVRANRCGQIAQLCDALAAQETPLHPTQRVASHPDMQDVVRVVATLTCASMTSWHHAPQRAAQEVALQAIRRVCSGTTFGERMVGDNMCALASIVSFMLAQCEPSNGDRSHYACLRAAATLAMSRYENLKPSLAADDDGRRSARAEQAITAGGGLCCFAWRRDLNNDADALLALRHLIGYASSCAVDHPGTVHLRNAISPLVDDAIFSIAPKLDARLRRDSTQLDKALTLVMDSSFQARGAFKPVGDRQYWWQRGEVAVDLNTGRVYVNGAPLTGLPDVVRNDTNFVHLFGPNCDLDVERLPNNAGFKSLCLQKSLSFPEPVRFTFSPPDASAAAAAAAMKTIPSLRVATINVNRGFTAAKIELFVELLERPEKPTVFLVSEWGCPDEAASAALKEIGLVVAAEDNRPSGSGGGAAILTLESAHPSTRQVPLRPVRQDVQRAAAVLGDAHTALVACYATPGDMRGLTAALDDMTADLKKEGLSLSLIGGDFNARHVAWDGGRRTEQSWSSWQRGDEMHSWFKKMRLDVVSGPTHRHPGGHSALDIVASSTSLSCESSAVTVSDPELSDHDAVVAVYRKDDSNGGSTTTIAMEVGAKSNLQRWVLVPLSSVLKSPHLVLPRFLREATRRAASDSTASGSTASGSTKVVPVLAFLNEESRIAVLRRADDLSVALAVVVPKSDHLMTVYVLPADRQRRSYADILDRATLSVLPRLVPCKAAEFTAVTSVVTRCADASMWEGFESPWVRVLAGFEYPTHMMICRTEGTVSIHLPRYGLRFNSVQLEANRDELECSGRVGYALSGTRLPGVLPTTLHLTRPGVEPSRIWTPSLVLERRLVPETDGSNPNRPRYIILLPTSYVGDLPDAESDERRYYEYEYHDHFQELRPAKRDDARAAAIHLATVYALSAQAQSFAGLTDGSGASQPLGMNLTGVEVAMRLLRRALSNHPLIHTEADKLEELAAIAPPPVFLMCVLLQRMAGGKVAPATQNLSRIACAEVALRRAAVRGALPHRERLDAEHWKVLFGAHSLPPAASPPSSITSNEGGLQQCGDIQQKCRAAEKLIRAVAPQLERDTAIVTLTQPIFDGVRKVFAPDNKVMQLTIDELVAAVPQAGRLPSSDAPASVVQQLRGLQRDAEQLRQLVTESTQMIEAAASQRTWRSRIYDATGITPRVGAADMVQLACEQSLGWITLPREFSEWWLYACAIRDLCARALALFERPVMDASTMKALHRELARPDDMYDGRAYWRALEAEMRISIRAPQFATWRQLMDAPGTVLQLNMGEGKTQVIIPMIILSQRFDKRRVGDVTRVTLLGSLLREAAVNYAHSLSHSSFGMHLVTFPFARDMDATPTTLARQNRIRRLLAKNGFVLLSREHRLSFINKQRELRYDHHFRSSTDDGDAADSALSPVATLTDKDMYGTDRVVDVFDEVDELMSPRSRLVYSVGQPMLLPASEMRFAVIPFVLRCVMACAHKAVQLGLAVSNCSAEELQNAHRSGTFRVFRLREPKDGRSFDSLFKTWIEEVWHELTSVTRFPAWLHFLGDKDLRAEEILSPAKPAISHDDPHRDVKLLLRGLLVEGVLQHCLTQRFRVQYGPPGGNRMDGKRVAVPYEAADLPSQRSEFALPDVAIVFTLLSYYEQGLTRAQFDEAMKHLLTGTPEAARAAEFDKWRDIMSKELLEAMPCTTVAAIRPEFLEQQETLHKLLRRNTAFVDFWVKRLVAPRDLAQYPEAITASSMDLLLSPHLFTMGFSGTKDSRFLLPMQLSQLPCDAPELQATDVEMLATLQRSLECVAPVEIASSNESPLWKTLLLTAVARECTVVIDCGAVLAGENLLAVAKKMISSCPEFVTFCRTKHLKGVLFHHDDSWRIVTLDNLLRSRGEGIQDSETFVIYNEAQCRGSDLKLRPEAHAMLTLGPNLTKSRLMQAAGRLRGLGVGQRISICGTPDVLQAAGIESGEESWPQTMLQWSIGNSIREVQTLLPLWIDLSVIHTKHDSTPTNAAPPTNPQSAKVNALYGHPLHEGPLADFVEAALGDMPENPVKTRALEFSRGATIQGRVWNTECEREVHIEKVAEVQQEREDRQFTPEEATNVADDFITLKESPNDPTAARFVRLDFGPLPDVVPALWVSPNFNRVVKEDLDSNEGLKTLRRIEYVWRVSPTGPFVALTPDEFDVVLDDVFDVDDVRHWTEASLPARLRAAVALYNGDFNFSEGLKDEAYDLAMAAYAKGGIDALTYFLRCRRTVSQFFPSSMLEEWAVAMVPASLRTP